MHQLALAYKQLGYIVYGYDMHPSPYTDYLISEGIKIAFGFNKNFLLVDKCIKTPAIKNDNKYVCALKKLNVPIVDRAQALDELASQFKCVIAVAGTHGKSTTASLIYEILHAAHKKVSCHIGADVFAPRFNLGDDFLVVEACEFNKSFLRLHPNIAVVTNVEADHLDSYSSMFALRNAFVSFLKRAQVRFVYNENSTQYLKKQNVNYVSGHNLTLKPHLLGEYNQKNIALAVAVCKFLKIDDYTIVKAINSFKGVPRRYEYLGKYKQTQIYIDYAHHPTEIKSFVGTFLQQNGNALIIFQPHTYSRTKYLIKEFLEVLSNINNLCIYKEYPAREKKNMGISAHELYNMLKQNNKNVKYLATVHAAIKQVEKYSAVAFVGAGDINNVALKIVKFIKNC